MSKFTDILEISINYKCVIIEAIFPFLLNSYDRNIFESSINRPQNECNKCIREKRSSLKVMWLLTKNTNVDISKLILPAIQNSYLLWNNGRNQQNN